MRCKVADGALRGLPLLILANKQDLCDWISDEDVVRKLQLGKLEEGRPWRVQRCCAVKGEGLAEGLAWLQGAMGPAPSP